jgi:selenocysteine lyase/cysteine desulfurase
MAGDESFWTTIRAKYRLKPDYINLESGYYSMQATPVLEAFIAKVREVNYEASTTCGPHRCPTRPRRATSSPARRLLPAELCITRNTTESIDTVVSGIDWKAGDEAVMAETGLRATCSRSSG